jgi:hypothetical protein
LIELGIVAGIYAGGALAFGAACHWLLPAHAKAHEPDLLSIDSTIHAVDIPPTTAREPGMATVAQLEN